VSGVTPVQRVQVTPPRGGGGGRNYLEPLHALATKSDREQRFSISILDALATPVTTLLPARLYTGYGTAEEWGERVSEEVLYI